MGNREYKKVFNDTEKLKEMLHLYSVKGHSATSLGRKYGIDHTSILWQCKKYGVKKAVSEQTGEPIKSLPTVELPLCIVCDEDATSPSSHYCSKRCRNRGKKIGTVDNYLRKELYMAQYKYKELVFENINPGHDYKYYRRKQREKKNRIINARLGLI